jgi:hypothetical protein
VVRVDTSAPDFGDSSIRYVEIAGDSALEVDGDGNSRSSSMISSAISTEKAASAAGCSG